MSNTVKPLPIADVYCLSVLQGDSGGMRDAERRTDSASAAPVCESGFNPEGERGAERRAWHRKVGTTPKGEHNAEKVRKALKGTHNAKKGEHNLRPGVAVVRDTRGL